MYACTIYRILCIYRDRYRYNTYIIYEPKYHIVQGTFLKCPIRIMSVDISYIIIFSYILLLHTDLYLLRKTNNNSNNNIILVFCTLLQRITKWSYTN